MEYEEKEKLVGMTFNMPLEWHTEFKVTATHRGLSMKELLEEAFECWLQKRGLAQKPKA